MGQNINDSTPPWIRYYANRDLGLHGSYKRCKNVQYVSDEFGLKIGIQSEKLGMCRNGNTR